MPTAIPNSWRYVPKKGSKEQGAQIDLLFDRTDDAITLCEIKYSTQSFLIDRSYAEKLLQKKAVFIKKTKTQKTILIALISTNGLKKSMYSEEIVDQIVTLRDLFQKSE